jgi:hypothetical protein
MPKTQRREPRFEVMWKTQIKNEFLTVYQASVHNVSANGVKVICDQPLREGSMINATVFCKHIRLLTAYSLTGQVVYCNPLQDRLGYQFGVNLTDIPESYIEQIRLMEESGHPIYE